MCSKGRNQSPIDLVADAKADLRSMVFDYNNPGRLKEVNTGHSIQENVNPGNYVSFGGARYELKQFHFHSPSEHTFDGELRPAEVHFVHQNEDGGLMVLGLFLEEGEQNEVLDELPMFRKKRGLQPAEEPLDYNDLVLDRNDYFLYNGSLTTPPCSEGVRWVVFKQLGHCFSRSDEIPS